MDQHKYFDTDSLSLASYLLTKDFPLIDLVRDTPKVFFVFTKSADLQKSISEYQLLQGLVEPQKYFSSVRFLKSVLHTWNLDKSQKR